MNESIDVRILNTVSHLFCFIDWILTAKLSSVFEWYIPQHPSFSPLVGWFTFFRGSSKSTYSKYVRRTPTMKWIIKEDILLSTSSQNVLMYLVICQCRQSIIQLDHWKCNPRVLYFWFSLRDWHLLDRYLWLYYLQFLHFQSQRMASNKVQLSAWWPCNYLLAYPTLQTRHLYLRFLKEITE